MFKEILFPNFVHYEDDMTIYKVFNKAITFYYFNKPYIAYRVHKKSITSNHTSKQMKTLIDFYNQLNSKNEWSATNTDVEGFIYPLKTFNLRKKQSLKIMLFHAGIRL